MSKLLGEFQTVGQFGRDSIPFLFGQQKKLGYRNGCFLSYQVHLLSLSSLFMCLYDQEIQPELIFCCPACELSLKLPWIFDCNQRFHKYMKHILAVINYNTNLFSLKFRLNILSHSALKAMNSLPLLQCHILQRKLYWTLCLNSN